MWKESVKSTPDQNRCFNTGSFLKKRPLWQIRKLRVRHILEKTGMQHFGWGTRSILHRCRPDWKLEGNTHQIKRSKLKSCNRTGSKPFAGGSFFNRLTFLSDIFPASEKLRKCRILCCIYLAKAISGIAKGKYVFKR